MTTHEPVIKWMLDLRPKPKPRLIQNLLETDTGKLHFLTRWERLCLWAGFTDVKTLNEKYR